MSVKFKRYQKSDLENLVQCMEDLQDFVIGMDPLNRLRRLPAYGRKYTDNLLRKVSKHHGAIFLAYDQEKIVGCIAGIIEEQTKDDVLGCVPTKSGRILELFVSDGYRGLGTGKELMRQMENHFKQNGCDIVRVEVFEPNKTAHKFYRKQDYSDRVIDMVKSLR
jgi:ribosomal protein S18 acetylase RimI-like enzyme